MAGSAPTIKQQRKFAVTADHGLLSSPMFKKAGLARQSGKHSPSLNRRPEPLQVEQGQRLNQKSLAELFARRRIDQHALGRRRSLEPSGEVGRRPEHGVPWLPLANDFADNNCAGGDTDPAVQMGSGFNLKAADLVRHFQSGHYSSLDLILVSMRPAKIDKDTVAEQSHGMSAEARHGFLNCSEVAADDCSNVLWVKAVGKIGRADKIAEEDGEIAPFGCARALRTRFCSMQRGNRPQQALAVTERQPKAFEVYFGQISDNVEINAVRAEDLKMSTQADRV
jgi:hypothetical protein